MSKQYKRADAEEKQGLMGGDNVAEVVPVVPMGKGGKSFCCCGGELDPNDHSLGSDLRRLGPLFILVFAEVVSVGLPVAILPNLATTELSRAFYNVPEDMSFLHTREGNLDPGCTVGSSWRQGPNRNTVEIGCVNGLPVGCVIPEASACPADLEEFRDSRGLQPCCLPAGEGGVTVNTLVYSNFCPIGLDGVTTWLQSQISAGVPLETYIQNPYYYEYSQQCTDGNAYAATAVAWADGVKNILTFILASVIGAMSDVYGRIPLLLWAEILTLFPNMALMIWFWVPSITIFPYYALRGLTGLMNSMAVGVALIADVTAVENRSVCIGLLIATGSIGIVSAPIGAALPYDLTFVLSNVISVGCILWIQCFMPETLPLSARKVFDRKNLNPMRYMHLPFRNKLFTTLSILIIFNSSSNKGLQDVSVYYLQQSFGFDDQEVGYIVVILGFGIIMSQALLLKPLIKQFEERGAIVFSIFAGLIYFVGIAVCGWGGNGQQWQAYIIVGVFGSLSVLVFPAVSAVEMRNSTPEEQGVIQGALFGLQSLAQALGGFLFAALYNWGRGSGGSGPAWRGGFTAYMCGAAFQVVCCVCSCLLPKRGYEPIPAMDKDSGEGDVHVSNPRRKSMPMNKAAIAPKE